MIVFFVFSFSVNLAKCLLLRININRLDSFRVLIYQFYDANYSFEICQIISNYFLFNFFSVLKKENSEKNFCLVSSLSSLFFSELAQPS